MQAWNDLVKIALLGGGRSAGQFPSAGGALGEALGRARAAGGELSLLHAGALLDVYRRSGQMPAAVERRQIDRCQDEDRPVCSERGERLIGLCLASHPELLGEGLELLAGAGRVISPNLLPDLLDAGRSDEAIRPALAKAMGRRGLWMAEQNPDWAYLSGASDVRTGPDTEAWETGSLIERVQALRQWRTLDPAGAREALQKAFGPLPAKERKELLAVLDAGLSATDEAFLEEARADRSLEVRRVATGLLGGIAGSALSRQVQERLQGILSWNGRKLSVALPDKLAADLDKEFATEAPPHGAGKKAGLLAGLLSLVPPGYWTKLWKCGPLDLLNAAGSTDYAAAYRRGWAQAAIRHRDEEWIAAVIAGCPSAADEVGWPFLLAVLSPQQREALVTSIVRPEPRGGIMGRLKGLLGGGAAKPAEHPVLMSLDEFDHRWSAEFTGSVLPLLLRRAEQDSTEGGYRVLSVLQNAMTFMDPNVSCQLIRDLGKKLGDTNPLIGTLDGILQVLTVRCEMRAAFKAG